MKAKLLAALVGLCAFVTVATPVSAVATTASSPTGLIPCLPLPVAGDILCGLL